MPIAAPMPRDVPDLMTCEDGSKVSDVAPWEGKRRAEVMEYFFSQEYGRTRGEKIDVRYELLTENKKALGGKATQRQVKFTVTGSGKVKEFTITQPGATEDE